eukprot:TRINITY_DN18735_c0_g1_i1.p1 TRINITY_DN18735_c0_g1~~TRINITY_DN18735_c0_g1_i1.p1  ORF type:complete len:214 (-),score=24.34 TRINITY_DN18735_c0_g1_i1:214-855(-)
MASQATSTFPCTLVALNGEMHTVHVRSDWPVWKLREHVSEELGIPEYELSFANDLVQLRSCDLLFTPQVEPRDSLQLILVRSILPTCFSRSQARDIWSGFVAFSRDHGDTVDGACASQLARFGGNFRVARQIRGRNDVPSSFSFGELLLYFSRFITKSPRRVRPDRADEDMADDVFDFGRISCARRQQGDTHAESESDARETEGDSDESDSDE